MESVAHSPFELQVEFSDPFRRSFMAALKKPLEHMLGLDRLNEHYAAVQSRPGDFAARSLSALNITYDVSPEGLTRIPKTGPLVIVANHPFGGLDGLILSALVRQVRPDAKILANFLLQRIPEMRDHLL